MKQHQVTNDKGIPFNVVLLFKGDHYGLKKCLIHSEEKPLIEFYDARYHHDPEGQFVSRYYAETLFSDWDRLVAGGLDLQGDVVAWKIDGQTMREALNFAHAEISKS